MRLPILAFFSAIVICSSSLLAQDDSAKSDTGKPATPVLEFRRAWYENEEGRVAANFKINGKELYLEPKAQITEADIKSVKLTPDQFSDRENINLELTEAGAKKMRELTEGHLRKPLAILINGKVVMAPTIQDRISSNISITGLNSVKETQSLAEEIQKRIDKRN